MLKLGQNSALMPCHSQSRASAIEKLQKALKEVEDKSALVSSLNTFVGFLMTLVADPNFKIAVASIEILGDLVKKVGREIGPQLKKIMPNLVEKFSDNKSVVRHATLRALKLLILSTSSQQVLEHISVQGFHHSNPAVREEAVNATIMIMMQHRYPAPDWAALIHNLCLAMVDSKDRVRAVALEALAVLHFCVGSSSFNDLIAGSTLTLEDKKKVEERLKTATDLPTVSNDGAVAHLEGVLPASSSTHAASSTSNGGLSSPALGSRRLAAGKLPWENSLLNQQGSGGAIDGSSSAYETKRTRTSDGEAGNGALEQWGRVGSSSRMSPGGGGGTSPGRGYSSSTDEQPAPASAKASILVQGAAAPALPSFRVSPSSDPAAYTANANVDNSSNMAKGIGSLKVLRGPLSADERSPASPLPPAPAPSRPAMVVGQVGYGNVASVKPSVMLPHSNDSSPASSAAESPSLSGNSNSNGIKQPPTYLYNNNSKINREAGTDTSSLSYAQRYQQQQQLQQTQQHTQPHQPAPFAPRLSILASPQANALMSGPSASSTFPPDPPRSSSSLQMHPPPSPGAVWARAQEDADGEHPSLFIPQHDPDLLLLCVALQLFARTSRAQTSRPYSRPSKRDSRRREQQALSSLNALL